MFNVRVYKTVWNKGEKEVKNILNNDSDRIKELNQTSYFYDVNLEFTPFIGLEIYSAQWQSGRIKRVSWSVDKKFFYCYTDDEYPSLNHDVLPYGPTPDFDEEFLKANCIRNGWKPLSVNDN